MRNLSLSRSIMLMAQSMQDQVKVLERQATAIEHNTLAMRELAESNRELVETILADEQLDDGVTHRTLSDTF